MVQRPGHYPMASSVGCTFASPRMSNGQNRVGYTRMVSIHRENMSVTPGSIAEKTTSGLLPPRWKLVGIDWANLKQWRSVEKTHSPHQELLYNFLFRSTTANVEDVRN